MATQPVNALDGETPRWLRGPWLPMLAAAICLAPGLLNGFTYDDIAMIVDNPRVRSLAELPEVWTSDWWQPADDLDNPQHLRRDRLYRPLTMTSFSLNYAVHGLWPLGFQLVNLLLHVLATGLVWRLGRRLLNAPMVAWVAALLFAVHPVHVEAVANNVGRAEVLSTIFILLGLLGLLRPGGARLGDAALAAGAFLLALTAKETAICYPVVAACAVVLCSAARQSWSWWLSRGMILLLPLVVYFPLRWQALGGHLTRVHAPSSQMNPLVAGDAVEQFVGVLTIAGHYVRLLLTPATLCSDYSYAVIEAARVPEPMTIVGLVAVLGAAFAAVGTLQSQATWRRVGWLTLMLVASYGLVSNAVIHIGVTVAERLMYWPSVPALLLAALGAVRLWEYMRHLPSASPQTLKLIRLAGVAIVVALALRSGLRATAWASNATLFATDVATYPQSAKLNRLYANVLFDEALRQADPAARQELLTAAALYCDRALEINPRLYRTLSLRAKLYLAQGDEEAAADWFAAAAQVLPSDAEAQRLALKTQADAGRHARRVTELEAALARDPNQRPLQVELGEHLLALGRYGDAADLAQRLVEAAPQDAGALWLLARTQIVHSELSAARETLRKVVALDPAHWQALTNLAVLSTSEDSAEAVRLARRAQQLAPHMHQTNQNLAETLAQDGQIDAAIAQYERILVGLPADAPLRLAVQQRLEQLRSEGR